MVLARMKVSVKLPKRGGLRATGKVVPPKVVEAIVGHVEEPKSPIGEPKGLEEAIESTVHIIDYDSGMDVLTKDNNTRDMIVFSGKQRAGLRFANAGNVDTKSKKKKKTRPNGKKQKVCPHVWEDG